MRIAQWAVRTPGHPKCYAIMMEVVIARHRTARWLGHRLETDGIIYLRSGRILRDLPFLLSQMSQSTLCRLFIVQSTTPGTDSAP